MKKYLVFLVVFLTSLFFTNNVSAAFTYEDRLDIDYNVTFNNYADLKKEVYYQYNGVNLSYSINNAFSSLINEFNNQTKYDSYFIFSGDRADVHMILFNKSSFYKKIDYYFRNNYGLYFVWYQKSPNPYENRDYTYYMNTGTISKSNIGYDINLKINGSYYYSYNEFLINSYNTTNKISYSSDFYIATNWEDLEFIYIDDKSNYSKDYNLGSGSVYKNVYYNNKLLFAENTSVLKKDYSYENLIDTKNINKIEIEFDTSLMDFNFDIDFLMQFSDNYIPKPYLESLSTYDSEDISQIEDFLNDMEDTMSTDKYGNEVYQYTGKFGLDFIKCKKLKLIIDTSSTIDSVYLKFISSINFNINFISTTEEENYYKTINLDNIYGVYLIPKVINADNFSTIYTNGIYNIQVRNNFNEENYNILYEKINFNEKIFQYQYYFNNNNCLIYFENTKYNTDEDDSYYITFDTRYFNYTIKENFISQPTIKNPNTNEEQVIEDIIIINENGNIIDNLKKGFNKGIFDTFTNIYNLIRNGRLGLYLFIIIICSIVILLVKSMKK